MDPKDKLPIWPLLGEDFLFPIPENLYPVIDNDLARDNLENDIPDADLQDLI